MAIVDFSVPDESKAAFQEAFARLMQQVGEERRRQQARAAAIDALQALRREQAPVSSQEIR